MSTNPSPQFVDFEALEDRLLFSASPMAVVDAPDEAFGDEAVEAENTAEIPEGEVESYFEEAPAPDGGDVPAPVAGLEEVSEADIQAALAALDWEEDPLLVDVPVDNTESEAVEGNLVLANTQEIFERLELLFVDTRVTGFEDLAENLQSQVADGVQLVVVTFDPTKDGLLQISEALAQHGSDGRPVDALHVISHAGPGQLRIGASNLTEQSLSQDQSVADMLDSWKTHLAEDADILLYGCSLSDGQVGIDFIQNLADRTGADVAASADATGSAHLGGNWELESNTGLIESATLVSTMDVLLEGQPVPVVTVEAPDAPFIGEVFGVSIQFENDGILADDTGYAPFVDLRVSPGVEVVGGENGFTYLGQYPVTVIASFSYDDLAALNPPVNPGDPITVAHPFAQIAGLPLDEGLITLAQGETYYVLELPFGSFAVGQPGAVITFDAVTHRSSQPSENVFPNAAGVIGSVSFQVGGGFRYGGDPLDNPGTDAPRYVAPPANDENGTAGSSAGGSSHEVRPRVWEVTTELEEAEAQAATGPNDPQTWNILVDIATGETLTNIVISDLIADNLQYIGNLTVLDADGDPVAYTVVGGEPAGGPGGSLMIQIDASVLGVAGTDLVISYDTYVPYLDADGVTVLNPATGAPVDISNSVDGTAQWVYDTVAYTNDPATGFLTVTDLDEAGQNGLLTNTVTLSAESLTLHKGVTNLTGGGSEHFLPGHIVEWTLFAQVSDYFQFDDLYVIDTLGDGQLFIDSEGNLVAGVGAPTFQWTEEGGLFSLVFDISNPSINQSAIADTALIDFGNFVVFHNGSQDPQIFDASAFQASAPADIEVGVGETVFLFKVSAQLLTAGHPDGTLRGDGLNGGLLSPASNTSATRDTELAGNIGGGQTTATITFRSVTQETYVREVVPGENNNIDMEDSIGNVAYVNGRVLDNTDGEATGSRVEEGSGAGLSVPGAEVEKTLLYIDGLDPADHPVVAPEGTVTWGLQTVLSTADTENLTITDFIPSPKFEVGEFGGGPDILAAITVFNKTHFDSLPGVDQIPEAGEIFVVLGDALFEALGGTLGAPAAGADVLQNATINEATNSFEINFDNFGLPSAQAAALPNRTIEIFLTLTATAAPMVDGLYLTNQQRTTYNNTEAENSAGDAIAQVQIAEPVVTIYKGVVATEGSAASEGGLAFAQAGTGDGFTGTLAGSDNAALIGALNLTGGDLPDAGDLVRFAIVAQNTGRADAFDVTIQDTIRGSYENNYADPAAFMAATNFQVYRGDGTLLVHGADYTLAWDNTGKAFTVVLEDNYNDGNLGTENRSGGLSRGFNAAAATDITNGSNAIVILYDLTVDTDAQASSSIVNTAELTNYSGAEGTENHVPEGRTDDATVVIASPEFEKTLTGTQYDEVGNNGDNQAVIGELVTYTLEIVIPEGSTVGATLVDMMDEGLSFVEVTSVSYSGDVSSTSTPGTGATPANVTIGNDGSLLTFDFGTITNSNTDNATTETITIVYQAVVLNDAGNQHGSELTNDAEFAYSWTNDGAAGGGGDTLDASSDDVIVVEPNLSITKGISAVNGGYAPSIGGLDAGDDVYYQIVISGQSGRPTAYNSILFDDLPDFLQGAVIVSVTDTASVYDTADFDLTGGILSTASADGIDIAGGQSITIIIQAVVIDDVHPVQAVSNTASVTWSSLPDGLTGDDTGSSTERTGSGGINDYSAQSTATLTIENVTIAKSVVATSEAHTGGGDGTDENSGNQVAIGEIVRYALIIEIPEVAMENMRIFENLPGGLTFLDDGTATIAFVSDGGTAITSSTLSGAGLTVNSLDPTAVTPTFALDGADIQAGAGSTISFLLGDISNTTELNNGASEYIVIHFNAIATNTVGNQAGATLPNTARVYHTVEGDEVLLATSNQVQSTVVEPQLTLEKELLTPGPIDGSDVLEYQVTITNESGANTNTAFDLVFTDVLPTGLTGAVVTGIAVDGVPLDLGALPAGVTVDITGDTITVTFESLDAGSEIVISYEATLSNTAVAGEVIENTGSVTYTSLPGDGTTPNPTGSTAGVPGSETGERTGEGDPGDPGDPNQYADEDPASFTVAQPTVTKSFVTTSQAHTDGQDLAIGETITYNLTVTFYEGITHDVILRDIAQNNALGNLEILSAEITEIGANLATANGLAEGDDIGSSGFITLTGTDLLEINFGDITNSGVSTVLGAQTIVIQVVARAVNVEANQNTRTLDNIGQLEFLSAGTTEVLIDTPAVTATIVEPALQVDRSVTSGVGIDGGDVLTVTVTLSHANDSSADAFDLIFVDDLPEGFFSYNTGSFTLVDAGGNPIATDPGIFSFDSVTQTLTLTLGDLELAGDEISFAYTVTLTDQVTPYTDYEIEGLLQWSSLPGGLSGDSDGQPGERTGAGDPQNDYAVVANDGITTSGVLDIDKVVLDTSDGLTADLDTTIGEVVTYHVTVTLFEGTTENVLIIDELPDGLVYVDNSFAFTAPGDWTFENWDVEVVDGVLTITADSITTPVGDDPLSTTAERTFTYTYQALVANVAGNTAGESLTNEIAVTADNLDEAESEATVDIVEPNVVLTKDTVGDVSGLDAGDIVTYEITLTNTGDAAAYNTIFADLFPGLIHFVPGSLEHVAGLDISTDLNTALSGIGTENGGFTLLAGQSTTFRYQVVLQNAVVDGSSITNDASVVWSSLEDGLNGDDPSELTERTGETNPGDPGIPHTYLDEDSETVIADLDYDIEKNVDFGTATIGDLVTYTITVTLGEGTTNNLVVTDTLPFTSNPSNANGVLVFQEARVISLTANIENSNLDAGDTDTSTPLYIVNGGANGEVITFTFGDIVVTGTAGSTPGVVVLEITALVTDVAANQDGDTLTNTVVLTSTEGDTVNDSADVDVIEPELQIEKSVDDSTPDVGQTLTYTLTISHASGNTAHDLQVEDTLPAGLTLDVASIRINGLLAADSPLLQAGGNTSTPGQLLLLLTQLSDGDGDITITYEAVVSESLTVLGTNLDNTVRLSWDSQVGDDPNQREYTPDNTVEEHDENPDPRQDTERVTVNASTIAGVVYHDADGSGDFTAGDTGLNGVQLVLSGTDINGNPVILNTTTDADGNYEFGLLPPSDNAGYTITQVQPAGYIDALETVGTDFGGTVSDALGANTIVGITVPVQSSIDATNYNFGEILPSSLAGSVYEDVNNDGIRQLGEPGIQDVTVTVTLTGTDIYGETVTLTLETDADGNYLFEGLRAGTYTITQDQTTVPVPFLDGKDTAGSEGGNAVAVNDQISGIVLGQDTDGISYLFGEVLPSELSGTVFVDLNGDGVFDAWESALPGVTVTLTGFDDLGNAVEIITTTDASGYYEFTDLRPSDADGYTITQTQPSGYTTTINTVGTQGGTEDAEDVLVTVQINSGVNGTGNLFGEAFDFDLVKSLVNGSAAHTTDPDVTIGETVRYRLEVNVPFGELADFQILDHIPDGLRFLNDGSATFQLSAGLAASGLTGTSGALPGSAISDNTLTDTDTYLAGTDVFFRLGTLTNTGASDGSETIVIEFNAVVVDDVMNFDGETHSNQFAIRFDTTGDGTSDPTGETSNSVDVDVVEPDLSITKVNNDTDNIVSVGQTIEYTIVIENTGTSTAFEVVLMDTVPDSLTVIGLTLDVDLPPYLLGFTGGFTGNSLNVIFDELRVGDAITITYQATVNSVGVAPGQVAPGEQIDNTAAVEWKSLNAADDAEGEARTYDNDATDTVNVGTGSLAQVVWFDYDGDGTQNLPGEIGLAGVEIEVTGENPDGTFYVLTVVTDADGNYLVDGLAAGDYTARVVTATLPPGATQTTHDLDDPAAGVGVGTPHETGVSLANGQNRTDVNFGYRGAGSIGDLVWNDLDGDGIRDIGEPGINGVTVALYLVDGNGTEQFLDQMLTTDLLPGAYSGVFGSYLFDGLMGGTNYAVRVINDNFDPGSVLEDTVPTFDPDNDPYDFENTPNLAAVTLGIDENRDNVDFGYQGNDTGSLGSVGDLVWFDINGDGIQDPGEVGLPDVFLFIDQNNNGTWDSTEAFATTDADGAYQISGLVGGNYTLVLDATTLPPGAVATYSVDGGFDPSDSTTWHFVDFTLGAGEHRNDLDFGYRGTHSIGTWVWQDQNADGEFDDPAWEPVMDDVRVYLFWDANGNGELDDEERNNGVFVTWQDLNGNGDIDPWEETLNPLQSATTTGGQYTFDNLFDGTYFVEVDSSTLPWRFFATHDLDDPAKPTVPGTPGAKTPHFATVTLAGSSVTNVDFGYQFIPPPPPPSPVFPGPENPVLPQGFTSIIPGYANSMVSMYFMTVLDPRWDPWYLDEWELVDSTPIFSSPLISGHAEPGSKIVLALYNHRGELISTTTVIADVGGNWTTGFAGVTVNGPLTIESTVAPGDFTALNDDSNFNFRTNYVTGLPGGYFQSRDTSVAEAFSELTYERLDAMSQQDHGETATEGWRKGDYEFLSQPALPGN